MIVSKNDWDMYGHSKVVHLVGGHMWCAGIREMGIGWWNKESIVKESAFGWEIWDMRRHNNVQRYCSWHMEKPPDAFQSRCFPYGFCPVFPLYCAWHSNNDPLSVYMPSKHWRQQQQSRTDFGPISMLMWLPSAIYRIRLRWKSTHKHRHTHIYQFIDSQTRNKKSPFFLLFILEQIHVTRYIKLSTKSNNKPKRQYMYSIEPICRFDCRQLSKYENFKHDLSII